ncbi:MAG: hypothetical protein P8012_18190, partial [Desulfobacterales bacterium]
TFALLLFIVLLGAYYQKVGVEARTMILPLAIFIAAGIVIARLKQIEYEIRSFKVNAKEVIVQNFSVIDANGLKRVSISTTTDTPLMTFFDKGGIPRATLDLLKREPFLKLSGDKGTVLMAFDEEGLPNVIIKDETENAIWTAR